MRCDEYSDTAANFGQVMSTARTLYDCDGVENSDELSFKKGEIITHVTDSEEEGWYIGVLEKSGQQGLFPANYVEIIPDKGEPNKPRKPSVAAKPPGIVGGKNNYTIRSSPSIISSSESVSSVPKMTQVIRRQGTNEPDTAEKSQETDSPSMSVKALRAKLENSGAASAGSKKQPILHEPSKPRTAPAATSPAAEINEEEPPEVLKPSELRKKWVAADAAARQSQSADATLRTNSKRASTVVDYPKRVENTVQTEAKPIHDRRSLQSSSFSQVPARPSPGQSPIIQPRPNTVSAPSPPRRPSTMSNVSSRSSVASMTEEEINHNTQPTSYSDRHIKTPPRPVPRRPEIQSQIYPSNKPSGPPLPSRPQSVSAASLQKLGPTPPPRPTPSIRPSLANPPRPASHMPPLATASVRKSIPVGDRMKYEKLFDQYCEEGYVYYETAFDVWRGSRIGDENLEKICRLVDIREDGWLDKKQFSAGMFLIDERLRGVCIPTGVPQGILQ